MAEQCGVLLCFPWDLLPGASVSGSQQLEEQAAERGWDPPAVAGPLSCRNHQKVVFHRGANTVMKSQQTSLRLEGCSAEVSLNLTRSREQHNRDRSACGGKAALSTPSQCFCGEGDRTIGTMCFSGDALPLPFFLSVPQENCSIEMERKMILLHESKGIEKAKDQTGACWQKASLRRQQFSGTFFV